MHDVDKVVSIALAEQGTMETPPDSNMTKYGEAYGWNGQPYCVMFLWWCFRQAGLSPLFFSGGKTASCSELMYWAIGSGRWVTDNYRRGDLVIMDFPKNKTKTDHIGIVERVEGDILYTIEGNTSPGEIGSQNNGDGVWRRQRNVKKVSIVGAVRPAYKEEDEVLTGEEIYRLLKEYLESQPEPEWAKAELREAMEKGITDGETPMMFAPRYQVAIMAKRAVEK